MRKLLLFCVCLLSITSAVKAQFTVQDTVLGFTSTGGAIYSNITNTTSGNIPIYWKVIGHDFPSDWATTTGICDNTNCYTSSILAGATQSANYAPGVGPFDLTLDLTSASMGTHWLTVRDSSGSTAMNTTFIIKKVGVGVANVTATTDEVVLYPNPATTQVNVIFNEEADVKSITICNVIGKVTNVYKVSANSARLELGNLPAGVYFVRLFNSQGNIVATRKFNKL